MSERRFNLLLITSGCDGTDVGEAWNSFQWASRLSKRHQVTLLTFRRRDKSPAAKQLPDARVQEWIDLPIVGRWERFNSMLKPGYLSFYAHARRWMKGRIRAGEVFDLVHQLSPVAMRYPSPAAGLGLPLVIGPVGGSLETPEPFSSELKSAPWYTNLRVLDEWRMRHDPWLKRSFASADRILCIAPYVKDFLGSVPSSTVELMSETGVEELPPIRDTVESNGRLLRMLFVGRMIRTKGARDAIRAVAKIKNSTNVRFDVVGDGYDLPACKEEAERLGVSDRVTFHGRLPRKQIDAFYANAHVFLFPSFREPGGIAVFEAMSNGLALIVADRGGPGAVVDDTCGIRVPVTEPEEFSSKIADAIQQLAGSPETVASMGVAAREKIRLHYLWDAKVRRIEAVYDEVLSAHGRKLPMIAGSAAVPRPAPPAQA